MLEIISNGSKWAGEAPDSVDTLLQVLRGHPLDHRLAPFVIHAATLRFLSAGDALKYANCVRFAGNFVTVSHVFHIYTDEPLIIDALADAIHANMKTEAYKLYEATPSVWDEAFRLGRKP